MRRLLSLPQLSAQKYLGFGSPKKILDISCGTSEIDSLLSALSSSTLPEVLGDMAGSDGLPPENESFSGTESREAGPPGAVQGWFVGFEFNFRGSYVASRLRPAYFF